MSSSKLPPEIADVVIDHLHEDEDALRACSLVCKGWLPASRLHLFSPLTVTPTTVVAFNDLLKHPLNTISSTVLHLRAFEGVSVPFSQLPCLSSLSLVRTVFPNATTDLHLLPHIKNLRTLELDRVFIQDVGEVVDIIVAIPSLENLTVDSLSWLTCERRGSVPNLPHRSPIQVHIDDFYGKFVSHLVEWFGSDNTLQLVSLAIGCFDFDPESGGPTEFIAPFLENLRITVHPESAQFASGIHIADQETFLPIDRLTKLRSFGVHEIELNFDDVTSIVSSWTIRLVSQTSPRLEELSLSFVSRTSGWEGLDGFDWDGLSECLSEPRFSGLKKFNISLIRIPDFSQSADVMLDSDMAERTLRERLAQFTHMLRVSVSKRPM